jgi:hypothetical protein
MRFQILAVAFLLAGAGCDDNSPNGKKGDMAQAPDLAPSPMPDMAKPGGDGGAADGGVKGHPGMAIMSGAVKSSSASYKVIMSLGQSPGDNKVMKSTNNTAKTGLVGATQGSKK